MLLQQPNTGYYPGFFLLGIFNLVFTYLQVSMINPLSWPVVEVKLNFNLFKEKSINHDIKKEHTLTEINRYEMLLSVETV